MTVISSALKPPTSRTPSGCIEKPGTTSTNPAFVTTGDPAKPRSKLDELWTLGVPHLFYTVYIDGKEKRPEKNTFFNVCRMLIHMDLFSFVGAGLAEGFFPRNLVSFRCARCWHDNLPRWLWSLLGDQNSYRRSRLSSCTGVDRFGVVIWSCFALFVWHVWSHPYPPSVFEMAICVSEKKSGEAGPADGDSHTDQTGIE